MKRKISFLIFILFLYSKNVFSQSWKLKYTYDRWGEEIVSEDYTQEQEFEFDGKSYLNTYGFSLSKNGCNFIICSFTKNFSHPARNYYDKKITLSFKNSNNEKIKVYGVPYYTEELKTDYRGCIFIFNNGYNIPTLYNLLKQDKVYDILLEGENWYLKCKICGNLIIDQSYQKSLEIFDTKEGKYARVKEPYRFFIEYVKVPEGVVGIPYLGFSNCVNLREIDLPFSLKTIEMCAFQLTGLETIKIPNVINFSSNIFSDSPNLKYIENPKCTIKESFVVVDNELNSFLDYTKEDISIPQGVKCIGSAVFSSSLAKVKSVIIPKSVEIIKAYAFADTFIETINIPDSIIRIENQTFKDCKKLKKIIIEKGTKLTELDCDKIFPGCDKLQSITLPKSVKLFNVPGNVQIIYY